MPTRKHIRPSSAHDTGDGLKLHRHHLRADGRDYQVITLRPGTLARFSTNFFHETWHLLSDPHGALLLGRLLWGLSYQRRPGTLVLIDRRFIDPNPFDAEPGDPIVLVPAELTHLSRQAARRLSHWRATEPATVRWHTWGLDTATGEWRSDRRDTVWAQAWRHDDDVRRADVSRLGGLLCARASAATLRRWAVRVTTMHDWTQHGMSYVGLEGPWNLCRGEGEVQTFADYHRRVSVAEVSRREVLAGNAAPAAPADLPPLIWARNTTVRHRRRTGPAL